MEQSNYIITYGESGNKTTETFINLEGAIKRQQELIKEHKGISSCAPYYNIISISYNDETPDWYIELKRIEN